MVRVIDATDAIAGRLSTFVAKLSLDCEQVVIVNAEKAIITGSPKFTLTNYLDKIHRGHPLKGPYTPRRADRILRRIIRGMLPYKKEAGIKALRRVKIYLGVPKEFTGKGESIKSVMLVKGNVLKYLTLEKLSKQVGGLR